MTPAPSSPVPAVEAPKAPLSVKEIAERLYDGGMRCNCDLDNWQPEVSTGHSRVCRIHKAAFSELEATR